MGSGIKPKQARSIATRHKLVEAAIEELLDSGYASFSMGAVARRAEVSRGAQQHHFPFRDELVLEAVRALIERQLTHVRRELDRTPAGPEYLGAVLDIAMDMCSGPMFSTGLELTLAAREEQQLQEAFSGAEAALERLFAEHGRATLGPLGITERDQDGRWSVVLAAARGVGLLAIFGLPPRTVAARWKVTRATLVAGMLTPPVT